MTDRHAGAAPPDDGGAASPSVLAALRERLGEERPYGLDDLALMSELDVAVVERLFTAAGRRSNDGTYGPRDVAYARELARLVGRLPLDVLERSLRARIRAVTQIVVTELAAARLDIAVAGALEAGSAEALSDALVEMADEVVPAMGALLAEDHFHVLRGLLDSTVVEQASMDFERELEVGVAFVDLVGFTRLSAAADPVEVGGVLNAFEGLVHRTVDDVGEVLLAKTIGDAVLLVSGDPDRLTEALRRIVTEQPPELEGVGRRAGAAHGGVLVRDGDYVGTTVNVAARLTDLARPTSVVVDDAYADRLDPGRWRTSRLPAVHLKGLGHQRPLRVRPVEERPAAP